MEETNWSVRFSLDQSVMYVSLSYISIALSPGYFTLFKEEISSAKNWFFLP